MEMSPGEQFGSFNEARQIQDLLRVFDRLTKQIEKQSGTGTGENCQDPNLEAFVTSQRAYVDLCNDMISRRSEVLPDALKVSSLVSNEYQDQPELFLDFVSTIRYLVTRDHQVACEFCKVLRTLLAHNHSASRWQEVFQFARHLVQFELPKAYILHSLKVLRQHPDLDLDYLSHGQMDSKKFLVHELERLVPGIENKFILLLGGWYGLFAQLLFQHRGEAKGRVLSVDIDAEANSVAESLNLDLIVDNWKFKTLHADMLNLNYQDPVFCLKKFNGDVVEIRQGPDLYVNTSCEHVKDFKGWLSKIPPGSLVALQSNDARQFDGHVNCVDSLEAFKEQVGFHEVLSEATLPFKDYNRFVLIGYA